MRYILKGAGLNHGTRGIPCARCQGPVPDQLPLCDPCGRALVQAYGSIERWQENFKTLGGMRGVGWVILFQDPQNGSLTNYWVSLHQDGIPARCKPLLVMDVWEHAFMRDYRASERLRYVDAFFTNIDWTTVERRFNEGQAQRSSAAA